MKAKDLKVDDKILYGGKVVTVTAVRRTSIHVIINYVAAASVGALVLRPSDAITEAP